MFATLPVDVQLTAAFVLATVGVGMTHQPSHFGDTASDQIDSLGGWSSFIQDFVFGGIVLKLQYQAIEGIDSFGGLLLAPVKALGRGMVTLVDSTILNIVRVFDAGTQATVLSFTDGVARLLGPLAQPTAVGVGMISIGVFIWMVNRLNISPLSFLRGMRG